MHELQHLDAGGEHLGILRRSGDACIGIRLRGVRLGLVRPVRPGQYVCIRPTDRRTFHHADPSLHRLVRPAIYLASAGWCDEPINLTRTADLGEPDGDRHP